MIAGGDALRRVVAAAKIGGIFAACKHAG